MEEVENVTKFNAIITECTDEVFVWIRGWLFNTLVQNECLWTNKWV